MGVADDGRRSSRHDHACEFGHTEHRALNVHVSIDETRGEVLPLQVDHLARAIVAQTHNPILVNRHIRRMDLAGVDVDDLRILQ